MRELLKLLDEIRRLKKGPISKIVDNRISEFKKAGKGRRRKIFGELCFCLLTANFNAERAIEIQKKIGSGFKNLPLKKLAKKLQELGHRFPNARAKYIAEARKFIDLIPRLLRTIARDQELRDWLAINVKGLGYKEASHLLRNLGRCDCAIIDFHIIDVLKKYKLIKKCDNLNKKKYLEIEQILRNLSDKANMNLAKLDLYLWYLETGKVLK